MLIFVFIKTNSIVVGNNVTALNCYCYVRTQPGVSYSNMDQKSEIGFAILETVRTSFIIFHDKVIEILKQNIDINCYVNISSKNLIKETNEDN